MYTATSGFQGFKKDRLLKVKKNQKNFVSGVAWAENLLIFAAAFREMLEEQCRAKKVL